MLIQATAKVTHVSEVIEKKGFKKCTVRIELPQIKDQDTDEVIRLKETFECEYAVHDEIKYNELKELAKSDLQKLVLFLRPFTYKDKDKVEKLSMALQLKKWGI